MNDLATSSITDTEKYIILVVLRDTIVSMTCLLTNGDEKGRYQKQKQKFKRNSFHFPK